MGDTVQADIKGNESIPHRYKPRDSYLSQKPEKPSPEEKIELRVQLFKFLDESRAEEALLVF